MTKLHDSGCSTAPLIVNTSAFSTEDLSSFLDYSEQVEAMQKRRLSTKPAVKTHEEIFECSTLDEDAFLKALENNTSYRPNLDFTQSIEDLMKYFDEDISVDVDSEPTRDCEPVEEVKKKLPKNEMKNKKKLEMSTKSKGTSFGPSVRRMAALFNEKINFLSAKIRHSNYERIPEGNNSPNVTEERPKANVHKNNMQNNESCLQNISQSKARLRKVSLSKHAPDKPPRKDSKPTSTCLVPEEVFQKLSVKDKISLFNKFVNDMNVRNPQISKNTYLKGVDFGSPSKTQEEHSTSTEGIENDRNKSVKEIGNELSANEKTDDKIENVIHVSRLSVVLKKSPPQVPRSTTTAEIKKTIGTPNKRSHRKKSISKGELEFFPSSKRTSTQICSSVPIEIYAPPKKIRRTRAERNSPRKFFKSQHLEGLFYQWLKAEHGMSFYFTKTDVDYGEKSTENEKLFIDPIIRAVKEHELKPNPIERSPTPNENKIESSVSNSPVPPVIDSTDVTPKESENETASDNKQANFDFVKPIRPIRKKKFRRNLTWKKENSIVEKIPVLTTDSDSDSKQFEKIQLQTKRSAGQMPKKMNFQTFDKPQQLEGYINNGSLAELDKKMLKFLNSPRKIKSAYTLTVMSSPSPFAESESHDEILRPSSRETSKSCPQLVDALANLKIDYEDLGFETGSNEFYGDTPDKKFSNKRTPKRPDISFERENSPLFIKLGPSNDYQMYDDPSAFSTPLKGQSSELTYTMPRSSLKGWGSFNASQSQILRRRSLIEADNRRNSLNVIREEMNNMEKKESPISMDSLHSVDDFFGNTKCIKSEMENNTPAAKSSTFWISFGDFRFSIDIYFNSDNRLRLLYDIFSQKSVETRKICFGIDETKFAFNNDETLTDISKRLPVIEGCSHYWFSTGDLAIPFAGNLMSPSKVKRIFDFIRMLCEPNQAIKCGVDDIEFSCLPEPIGNPKFSIDSNYSILVGLNGQSNGLEGRSKFSWPNTSANSGALKTSDLEPSEFDSEFDQRSPFSFSPFENQNFDNPSMERYEIRRNSKSTLDSLGSSDCFISEFDNEPLDKLFEMTLALTSVQTDIIGKPNMLQSCELLSKPLDNATTQEIVNNLREQQRRLLEIEQRIKTHSNPSNFANNILQEYEGSTDYMKKLENAMNAIQLIGKIGYSNCSQSQLESFVYFLSRYADNSLTTCVENINCILDELIARDQVQV